MTQTYLLFHRSVQYIPYLWNLHYALSYLHNKEIYRIFIIHKISHCKKYCWQLLHYFITIKGKRESIKTWRIFMYYLSWLIMYFLFTVTLVVCNKCVISALADLKSTTHSVIDLSQPTTRILRRLLLSSPGFYHRTLTLIVLTWRIG